MYRRLTLTGILLLLIVFPCIAKDEARIAVLDFEVQSDNPAYKYLGKGFAEFLAVELAAAKGVTIIERERRNAILEEQEFALTDLSEKAQTIQIGKLMAAEYLLAGSVFDVLGQLAVTVKLIDVQTSATVVSQQADGPPETYKQLVAELAEAIVRSLALTPAPVVVAARPEPEIGKEEAKEVLTSFSEAVDAVDKKDVKTAREKLKRAEKIDRTNRAVEYYLNKLFATSPKFNAELIFYAPSFNPAYLGFVDKDRFYFTSSNNLLTPSHVTFPNPGGSHADFNWEVIPGLYYRLGTGKGEFGYYLPIGKRLGIGAELAGGANGHIVRDKNYQIPSLTPGDDVYLASSASIIGGRLSAGISLNERLAVGASTFLFNSRTNLGGRDGPEDPRSNTFSASVTLGAYSRWSEGKLTLDTLITAPFLQEVYIDYSEKEYVAYKTAPYPLVWETSLVTALGGNRLYAAVKEVAEIYVSFGEDERRGIASRSIGALEWWVLDFLSIRAGGEYDFLSLLDNTEHGFGAFAGLTVRWGSFDLDANYTYMERALRFYPGLSGLDGTLLVQLSWNGAFIKERKK
jgi:TolB-like protein